LPIFEPQKFYNPLSAPVLSSFISARLFSVPQVENEVKRLHSADVAEIQEEVTDERRSKKRNFRQLFRNSTTTQKPVYIPMGLILNLKKGMCLPCVSSILKKNQS